MIAVAAQNDPLAFDFGIGFKSSAERVKDERPQRLANADRQLPFGNAFLDDCLRSIMPNDLIVIGARTGVGKTELARSIATHNASTGRRVHYFALEAEQNEIERRTKYGVLARLIFQHGIRLERPFNYPDWYRGRFESTLLDLEQEADAWIVEKYKTLYTYYRGARFTHEDIARLILAEQDRTDLIVLDHLHYVDNDDDNEHRGTKEIVQTIRNVALLASLPIILVVHLRKKPQGSKSIVPSMDDVHGSSEIGKVCTHTIMIEPAYGQPSHRKNVNNTLITIPKDRGDGAKHLIALAGFDWRTKSYTANYTLGREVSGKFEPLGTAEVPFWAERHEPLSVPMDIGSNAALEIA